MAEFTPPRLRLGRNQEESRRIDTHDGPQIVISASEVLNWLGTAPAPATTHLLHGEPKAAEFLRERIHERLRWTVVVPRQGEKVLLP